MYVNGKMRPVATILGMGKGRIKENDGGSELNYDNICYIVRNFVNFTMCPQHSNNFKK
jgi:hypothetical protein